MSALDYGLFKGGRTMNEGVGSRLLRLGPRALRWTHGKYRSLDRWVNRRGERAFRGLMHFAYDKEGLQVRVAGTVLLQLLGIAGVLITLKVVASTPSLQVTNDAPIACLDSGEFARAYSFDMNHGTGDPAQIPVPDQLLAAMRDSRPHPSLIRRNFKVGLIWTPVPNGGEIDGRFVACWFQPVAHGSCARAQLVAPMMSRQASDDNSVSAFTAVARQDILSDADPNVRAEPGDRLAPPSPAGARTHWPRALALQPRHGTPSGRHCTGETDLVQRLPQQAVDDAALSVCGNKHSPAGL